MYLRVVSDPTTLELFIICLVAFFAAILTFFSGFGLGTILTPVLMIFFPVETAIALTGIVHFINNVFKIILVGKHADFKVLKQFGIPSVIFAFIGAMVLLNIPDSQAFFEYELMGKQFEVYPLKFTIAVLLFIFAAMDLIPYFRDLSFGRDKLALGGALSGFFGGLSGNQGALRTAFLIKAGLSKTSFIGTAVVVSTFVDFTRIGVYATRFGDAELYENMDLMIFSTLAAILGAFLGNKLLKKVTLVSLQIIVAIMLLVLSLALAIGLV